MEFPSPTPKQARLLWFSLTALAVSVSIGLLGLLTWGLGWVASQLSAVLLPLAIAGIAAYLLEPVVDFFGRRNIPRIRAILLVFFLAIMSILILVAVVLPPLMVETKQLIDQMPTHAAELRLKFGEWLSKSPWGQEARAAWDTKFGASAQSWMTTLFPTVCRWLLAQFNRVASWAGLAAGLALVPVYVFYFLREKREIQAGWTRYLPLRESKVKEELVFVLTAINNYLIVFFRGQLLVALCDGALLTAGFLIIGLDYAFLLGITAGILSVIPYLGILLSIVPAVTLAAVQSRSWLLPLLVMLLFAFVQMLEGLVISPWIMRDRVGLHPLAIIIAVLLGTTLMGGLLGGLLAIPLAATLRVLMFRYVWRTR